MGVCGVEGEFERGEALVVNDRTGHKIAQGIARYNAADAARLMGRQSSEIESILGYEYDPMLIHADDMIVLAT